MFFDGHNSNHIFARRVLASLIDFSIEVAGGFLGGYFGAMIAALVIAIRGYSSADSQNAIWTGMICGFIFWGLAASWLNRVLIQGISRSSFGKKMLNLEIITKGAPVGWKSMNRNWISFSMGSDFQVVSSLDQSQMAPVISINGNSVNKEKAEDKKAA